MANFERYRVDESGLTDQQWGDPDFGNDGSRVHINDRDWDKYSHSQRRIPTEEDDDYIPRDNYGNKVGSREWYDDL